MLQQKIGYIDLYKGGVKCGNMGHVRLEWQGGRYRFDVSLCRMDRQTIVTAIVERSGRESSTRMKDIPIIHGKGQYQSDWMRVYGNEERMLFEASGGIYGVCVLPQMECAIEDADAAPSREPAGERGSQADGAAMPAGVPNARESENAREQAKPRNLSGVFEGSDARQDADRAPAGAEREFAEVPEDTTEDAERDARALEAYEKRVSSLSDDKWKQLCNMYETVRPIDAEIDFLKIAPEDFVILRQEFQGLVRNSFLLHGYYNYNHILLGKYPDRYYIGVPGIMHEQERMAAAMFGFVGFERAKSLQEEDNSDFGYYMMEVEI